MGTTRWAVGLTLLLSVCSAWEPRFHLGRRKGGMRLPLEESLIPAAPQQPSANGGFGAKEGYISQKIDHFNQQDQRTWSQRYFANMQFASQQKDGVAFLNMGGEGPESMYWVQTQSLPWLQWATQVGAAVFSLEHRFYGKSRPFSNQSVDNLQYLNSRQALADAAEFIKQMNVEYNLGNAKWVVFGGSYSGALSLWMRQLYPDLVVGSVGSSAPVQATFDFYKYLEKVQFSLGYDYAGGSADCVTKTKQAFDQIIKLMNTVEGRATLSQTFNLSPAWADMDKISYNDIQNFFSTMYGNFQGAVQYSGDNANTGWGIPEVCQKMTTLTTPNDPLAGIKEVNAYMNGPSTDNNYTDMIQYLQIEDFEIAGTNFDSGARSWTWQTCTEFGYFQTTDVKEDLIFGPVTAVNLFSNMCKDVFGDQFTSDYIQSAVDATNKFYGGADKYQATNVVIPNGNVDPWSMLGKVSSSDISVVPYLINGTAHCADMYPPKADGSDKPGLAIVHQLISMNINRWVKSPATNRTANVSQPWQRPQDTTNSASFTINRAKRDSGFVGKKTTISEMAVEMPTAFKKIHLGRPPHGFRPAPEMPDNTAPPQNYEDGFFIQPVDHFDNQNPNTFQQRYFKNGQWARAGGPMFIMIGGEGPESSKWVLNGNITYLTWAQEFGATVYLLEHRYYGESKVGANGPTQNMKYLSSLQMLYDVANFIKTVNYQTGNSAPWVVFGGSYSGAMALWMRQVFPDLVLGAVGSSGPIQAKLDFYEYLQVVEASIRSYSNDCAENIRSAFEAMHDLILTKEGRQNLSNSFNLSPPFDENNLREIDKQFFFSNIFGQFQGAVQYSGDNSGAYAESYGIPYMCSFMLNNQSTPLQNVIAFNKGMTEFYTGANFTSTDNSYDDFVAFLKSGGQNTGDAASKYWTWQTCTEFGYFQSSDLGYNIFGSPTPVNLYTQMCKDVFGAQYSGDFVENSVKYTNYQYGGRDGYKRTNVVIPNGSIDPWHALGKFSGQTNDPSAVMVFINGTAHCADMYPARPADLPSLTQARGVIRQNLASWINGGAPVQPTVGPVTQPTNTVVPTPKQSASSWTMTTVLAFALLLLH